MKLIQFTCALIDSLKLGLCYLCLIWIGGWIIPTWFDHVDTVKDVLIWSALGSWSARSALLKEGKIK